MAVMLEQWQLKATSFTVGNVCKMRMPTQHTITENWFHQQPERNGHFHG